MYLSYGEMLRSRPSKPGLEIYAEIYGNPPFTPENHTARLRERNYGGVLSSVVEVVVVVVVVIPFELVTIVWVVV